MLSHIKSFVWTYRSDRNALTPTRFHVSLRVIWLRIVDESSFNTRRHSQLKHYLDKVFCLMSRTR